MPFLSTKILNIAQPVWVRGELKLKFAKYVGVQGRSLDVHKELVKELKQCEGTRFAVHVIHKVTKTMKNRIKLPWWYLLSLFAVLFVVEFVAIANEDWELAIAGFLIILGMIINARSMVIVKESKK